MPPQSRNPKEEVAAILRTLLPLPPEEAERELDRLTAGSPELRNQVRRLLFADTESETFVGRIVGRGAARFAEDNDPIVGSQIGPYRVLHRIGEGGMSVVYLAERADEVFERQVCLKLIKRGMDTDAVLRRFEYERKILAGLDHPNVAHLYDGGSTEDGRPYFVMEYVDGSPITRFCESGDLELGARLDLFRTVCGAIQYAHGNLVVHRDLKPANILVTDEGVPKLLDFGIAALLGPDRTSATGTGGPTLFFTPAYASPEQIRGERVTTRTDVYSLAVLLYELLSGSRPYVSRSRSELDAAILAGNPERPSVVSRRAGGRGFPADLDNIVLRGMASDPDQRYPTPAGLAEDLVRYQKGLPVEAQPASAAYRAWKFVRRNQLLSLAGAALTLFAIWAAIQSFRLERAREEVAGALITAQAATEQSREERDRAEETARLLAEVIGVAEPSISFREAPHDPALAFGRGSFSISAWIRVERRIHGPTTILDKRVPPFLNSRGISLFLYEGRFGLQLSDGEMERRGKQDVETGGSNYVGHTDLADDAWHHLVASVRRDPNGPETNWIGLFVDGRIEHEVRGREVRDGDLSNEAPLRVGFESDGFHIASPFRGQIREVEVYGQPLDASTVGSLHRWGRRHLLLDGAYIAPASGMPGDTVSTSLVINKRSDSPASYTWVVAGSPDREGGNVGPTKFSPTSGTLRLGRGVGKAEQEIRIILPGSLTGSSTRFVATIADTDSRDRMRAIGTIHLTGQSRGGISGSDARGSDERGTDARGTETPEPTVPVPARGREGPDVGRPRDPAERTATGDWPVPLDLDFEVRLRPNELFSDASIRFGIVGAEPTEVEIEVIDLSGAVVRRIDLGHLEFGQHSVIWDGTNEEGVRMENGIYAINILARNQRVARWDDEEGELRRVPVDVIQRKVFVLR